MILTQGVSATFDTVPGTSPLQVDCVLNLSNLKQTRATESYTCMSNNDEYISVGSVTRDNLTLGTMYGELATDGQELLKTSFETNALVDVLLEFDNIPAAGTTGTQISGEAYVISYEITMEKDKAVEANFELGWSGPISIIPAA